MRQLIAGVAFAVAALGLGTIEANAETIGGYTSFWTLGDSLSDDGNLYAATGGAAPPPPYFEGRFSNGRVWSERIARDFARKGRSTGNFAYGGAAVEPLANGPFPSPPVVNLGGQIELFAEASAGKLGKRPLASLWFGANDLLFNGVPKGTAKQVGRAAARGVADGALALQDLGVNDVVLFNLPKLDKIPLYAFGTEEAAKQARAGSRAFNRTLDRRADRLRDKGLNVTEINISALFDDLLENPLKYGVINATLPCLIPTQGVYCGSDVAPLLAFFDPVHPSSTIHRAIADEVRAEVAAVPMPAPALLLVAGIAGIGLLRLRAAHGSRIA